MAHPRSSLLLGGVVALVGCVPVVAGVVAGSSGGGGSSGSSSGAAPAPSGPAMPILPISLNPATGPAAGGQVLVASGSSAGVEFTSAPTVTIGGQFASNVSVLSPTSVSFVAPRHAQGNRTAQVQVEVRASTFIATSSYGYVATSPTLSSITPATGPSDGGTAVTLLGTGFVAGCRVTVGGAEASAVSVNGETAISFLTPRGTSNSNAVVRVIHPDGFTVDLAPTFRYGAPLPPPTTPPPPGPTIPRFPSQVMTLLYGTTSSNSLDLVRVVDANMDGRPEVFGFRPIGNERGFGAPLGADGSFGPPPNELRLGTTGNRRNVLFGDLITGGGPELAEAYQSNQVLLQAYPYKGGRVVATTPSGSVAAITVGDLDGQLGLDLIFCAQSAVYSTLGDGAGNFGARNELVTAATPHLLVTGHIDADGKLDVLGIRANNPTSELLVFRGNGDGTLQAPSTITCGQNADDLKVGDVTGDGKLDAIVRCVDKVQVFAGDGAGAFAAPVDITGLSGAGEVAVADLDGDGRLDLAVGVKPGSAASDLLAVLRGTGGGAFAARVDHPVNPSPESIAVGDVDRDGVLDVVVGSRRCDTVVLLRGRGDGTLRARSTWNVQGYRDLALGDMDGDGRPDAVLPANSELHVRRNDGAGGLLAAVVTPAGTAAEAAVVLGHLDTDGKLDVVLTNVADKTITAFRGNGAGGTLARADVTLAAAPGRPVLHDVNRDGRLDVLAPIESTAQVAVLLGDGAGGLGAPSYVATGAQPVVIALGDIDGDGLAELVVGCVGGTKAVHAHRGLTGGAFGAAAVTAVGDVRDIVLHDATGDGRLDAFTIGMGTDASSVVLLTGTSLGSLSLTAPTTAGFTTVVSTRLALAQVNADAVPDVVTTQQNGTAGLLLGRMNGVRLGFATSCADATYEAGIESPRVVRVADMNGDGKADLVGCGTSSLTVLLQE